MMKNPGWVDLQVNGHNGVNFSAPDLTETEFLRAADELLAAGTAVFLPTLITSPAEVYQRNLPLIRRAVERHGLAGAIPGVHLEGPFIARGAIGSHNPGWVLPPSPEAVELLFRQSENFIRLITVSADAPGAPAAISRAAELGIAVSVGHHLADAAQLAAAADAGARALTHLGNGIPNQIDRHRNPIWAGLGEDRLTAMIITDGHHLPDELIKIILRVKTADRVIVTSDASEATGYPPGPCRVLGNDAVLTPEGKLYSLTKNCLVAAAVTLDFCMKHLASLGIISDADLLKVGRTNALRLIRLEGTEL